MAIVNGNGNANLWLDNSAPYTPPPFSNLYSVKFNGIDQRLQNLTKAPLLGALGTGNWSVSFWVKVQNMTTTPATNQRLWAFGAGGTLQTQMYITTTGNLQFGGPWSDGFGWGAVAGTWYHVIYRADTSAVSLNVGYVLNGSTINSKNQVVTTTFDETGATYIGRNGGSYGFEGWIDEFAVWNKYLTNAECLEIYNGGAGVDLNTVAASGNLQHWWRMGDPDGTASYATIDDAKGGLDLSMENQVSSDITTDVP
ncbi:MAG: LamG domain-containing protein [Deltaproteobacteria bacterium]|jgi:hypothetical protein|nr:LamG domain-containing protein [Deltaproteobacteria bacterium]